MEEKENGGKNLFNRMVKAGKRTYFISVREAKNNQKYIMLTESKLIEKDKFDRFNIMVFGDKIGPFVDALKDAYAVAA